MRSFFVSGALAFVVAACSVLNANSEGAPVPVRCRPAPPEQSCLKIGPSREGTPCSGEKNDYKTVIAPSHAKGCPNDVDFTFIGDDGKESAKYSTTPRGIEISTCGVPPQCILAAPNQLILTLPEPSIPVPQPPTVLLPVPSVPLPQPPTVLLPVPRVPPPSALVATFNVQNENSDTAVTVQLFSTNRRWKWPAEDIWANGPVQAGSCRRNELICLGAWRKDDPTITWGAGHGFAVTNIISCDSKYSVICGDTKRVTLPAQAVSAPLTPPRPPPPAPNPSRPPDDVGPGCMIQGSCNN